MTYAIYAIIADGEYDQTCESYEDMLRECDDLRELGCRVRRLKFFSWEAHDAWLDSRSN